MSHIVYTYVLGMGNVTLLLEKCECLSGNATEYATPTVKFHRLDTLQKGCKRDNSYVFFFPKTDFTNQCLKKYVVCRERVYSVIFYRIL